MSAKGDSMEWMLMPLRRYADFSGRSRRLEYWMFTLFLIMVFGAGIGLLLAVGATENGGTPGTMPVATVSLLIVLVLLYLAVLIPIIAVQVRRFHDQDKSGWFVLLSFIPYVGGIIMLVFMCIDGTPGPNRFGPDPKGRGETLANVFT